MKEVYYRQCKMRKENKYQTSWIPEQYATKGRVLRLRSDGEWDNGWIVEVVSETRLLEKGLPDAYNDIKKHKKATGDNL